MIWDPIVPGEPTVFLAGEYEWMEEPWYGVTDSVEKWTLVEKWYKENNIKGPLNDNYVVKGFDYPSGWAPSYYLPCVDSAMVGGLYGGASTKSVGAILNHGVSELTDAAWTGAFQRKVFRTKMPDPLNASIKVEIEDLRSVDATVRIIPDKKIYRYIFTILDEASYRQLVDLLDGNEDYLQWAITSYFSYMNFGSMDITAGVEDEGIAPAVEVVLSDYFQTVSSQTKFHVLVTGMSGEIGSPQCFHHSTFSTPATTKIYGPEIEVTAMPELTGPYSAVFNVKCVSREENPLVRCYYGANYYKDWILDVNAGGTYEQYGMSTQFTNAELEQINSDEGYTMAIPSIDGMTTRLVVVGFNDENISNGVDLEEDVLAHPAVDDCTTPFAEADKIELNPLLDAYAANDFKPLLNGEWTLTATVLADGKTQVQSSKVKIKNAFVEGEDYPSVLPDSVFTLYDEATEWEVDEILAFYDEFKDLAEKYNEKRLRNQNKLLLEGWLDNDSKGRLSLMTPWDMFISREISTVNVEQMFTEFGPKMHIKVNKDLQGRDSLTITANRYYCSPVLNWSVPFYMAGYANQEANNTLFYFGTTTEFHAPLEFPVVLSEDKNTLTIKGFEANGVMYYPNVIGIDPTATSYPYIIDQPIISDVVLTRGWTDQEDVVEPAPATRFSWGRKAHSVSPVFEPTLIPYGKRSKFEKVEQRRTVRVDYEVITHEKLMENFEKYNK